MKKYLIIVTIFLTSFSAIAQRYTPIPSREEQLNEKYCTGLFATPDGTYFDLENDASAVGANSYINILDWLQGRVAGLQVYNYRGIKYPFLRNQLAAIYVDEMRMDANFLNLLPVNDIAMIKVMRSPMVGLWGAPGGAIAIYTKDGEGDEEEETEETR